MGTFCCAHRWPLIHAASGCQADELALTPHRNRNRRSGHVYDQACLRSGGRFSGSALDGGYRDVKALVGTVQADLPDGSGRHLRAPLGNARCVENNMADVAVALALLAWRARQRTGQVIPMIRIIVFAKAPQAGFAKTRLIPVLGPAGAARLALRMLLRTLDSAVSAAIGPVELCATPEIVSTAWLGVDIAQEIEISAQGGGDLGARLARATQRALEYDEAVLLIGTDCVEMSAQLLREAAVALKHKDAVIYPAADGGYALLGLTEFHSSLFSNIAFITDSVAAETVARIRQFGWSLD